MRIFLIIFVLLLVAVSGYAYSKDPAGCAKLGTDFVAIFRTLIGSAPVPDQTPLTPATPRTADIVPAPSSTPAPTPVTATPPPAPPPIKVWAPPAVLPAQPNWTWTAQDGTTYQNVVITKVDPDTVTITHSMGVAHLPISTVPPDIQKQLNYDPVAAAAARAERQRELDHPYYTYDSLAEAQRVARQLHLPLAWMDAFLSALSVANPIINSEDEATQMALNNLKSQTIVILIDGENHLGDISSVVRDQLFILDDGPMPGGHHFYAPKVVFTDPDITKAYGRVSYTQMKANREWAFESVLASIPKDTVAPTPTDTSITNAPAPASSSPATPATPTPTPAP